MNAPRMTEPHITALLAATSFLHSDGKSMFADTTDCHQLGCTLLHDIETLARALSEGRLVLVDPTTHAVVPREKELTPHQKAHPDCVLCALGLRGKEHDDYVLRVHPGPAYD